MYFNKFPYRSNFEFISEVALSQENGSTSGSFQVTDYQPISETPFNSMAVSVTCQKYQNDIYYLGFESKKWPKNYAQSELVLPEPAVDSEGATTLKIDTDLGLTLTDKDGNNILKSIKGQSFGISGNQSIFQFNRSENFQFYGMGEKMFGMELSGRKTKFWNTDVWGDFHHNVFWEDNPDPQYVSVPYLIIKQGNTYIGLLLDNPYATFIHTDSKVNIAGQKNADEQPAEAIAIGAEHGQPNLIIIYGPTLAELTQKLQQIVGVTPLPPAWSLGYQQCRWGYQSYDDLSYINAGMDRFEIPCDGLWLDIEYMRGYRVFTFEEEKNWPNLQQNIADIQKNGRRIIPIIDPGVKAEAGYEVYDSGHEADVFCKNPQGQEYIGLVWPGETVFPDYSTEKGRSWWSNQVKGFASQGITGAWLDMNDPSTGQAQCIDMLYNDGKDSHYTYHNQYALGMAKASRDGFAGAFPEDRPFLLSRSGFTGMSKFAAIWTGDNVSNYHYLKASIPCTLNLALSGIPFNGPDAGGFGGDTSSQLMIDWHKAGFLFPFFRNHCIKGAENQEPWVFDNKTLAILRRYIRLRYQLRPYLYNLFINQEESGEAILRPLFYDFEDTEEQPLGTIGDQFMVGSAIMQAPFVEEDLQTRHVVMPNANWFDCSTASWLTGNSTITVDKDDQITPIYLRAGSVIPMTPEVKGDHTFKSNDIEMHVILNNNSSETAQYCYKFDDGQTLAYQNGKRSQLQLDASVSNGNLDITTKLLEDGYGDCDVAFVLYDQFKEVTVNGQKVISEEHHNQLTDNKQQIVRIK